MTEGDIERIIERRTYEGLWSIVCGGLLDLATNKKFGMRIFHRSSVLENFPIFVAGRAFQGKRCVEIGTRKGLTAIVLSRHFDEVVTIDVEPDDERQEIADFVGAKNIKFITVKDNAEKAEIINGLEFDGAYVDGDHARDTEADFALVKRCGRVLFHEYWKTQEPVWNLVNRLVEKRRGVVSIEGKFALWQAK